MHSLEDQITVHLQTSNNFSLRNTLLGNVQPTVPTGMLRSSGKCEIEVMFLASASQLSLQKPPSSSEGFREGDTCQNWNLDRYDMVSATHHQSSIKQSSSGIVLKYFSPLSPCAQYHGPLLNCSIWLSAYDYWWLRSRDQRNQREQCLLDLLAIMQLGGSGLHCLDVETLDFWWFRDFVISWFPLFETFLASFLGRWKALWKPGLEFLYSPWTSSCEACG